MTDVKVYMARPIQVEAVQLVQYGDFVRTAAWVSESKGKTTAYFKPASKINGNVDTLVLLKNGNVYDVRTGDFVIRTADGEFTHLDGDSFLSSFDELGTPVSEDWDTFSGTNYQPTGKPGRSLLGAAALQVPT
jgi:hypothetical protein